MRNKIVLLGIIAIFLFVGMLSACDKTATTTSTSKPTTSATATTPKQTTTTLSSTTAAPQYGGTLKIINRGTVMNMGYPGAAITPDDGTLNSPAIEKLVSLDTQGNLIPWLATGWQNSSDNKYLTMTLRKGVKFHDGTLFNATAAKYNLDMFKAFRPELKSIASIDVVDDYTIKFNYATFDPTLVSNLAFSVGFMFSPTAVNTNGKEWATTHPIGTGPYKFVSFTPDVSVKYVRFDDYWGGKPYLDAMEFNLISDAVTALASFKAGEGQASIIVGFKDAADMQATNQYSVVKSVTQVDTLAPDSNNSTSPFYDIRVRQAVAYSLDNAAIAKVVGYGFYTGTNQVSAPGYYAYNPAVVGYPYNPDKAKQLLKEAGYPNFKTTITFQTSPQNQDAVTAVQAYLSAIGIDAKLDSADTSRYTSTYTNGWNNAMLFPLGIGLASDPSGRLQTPLSSKRTRYVSVTVPSDYDKLLLSATVNPDATKRQTEFQTLMKMITDQYCLVIPIYVEWAIGVTRPQVHDFTLNAIAPGIWHPESVWLSK
jgi:peptide/nickel transport system substrate-binding protein